MSGDIWESVFIVAVPFAVLLELLLVWIFLPDDSGDQ